MMFRKCFVLVMLAAAVLLVATCDEPVAHSASVEFITPTDNQLVLPGVVPVRVQMVIENGLAMTAVLTVDGTEVGVITSPPETCDFTWDASNAVPGSKPILKALAYWYYYDKDGRTVNACDSSMITTATSTRAKPGRRTGTRTSSMPTSWFATERG